MRDLFTRFLMLKDALSQATGANQMGLHPEELLHKVNEITGAGLTVSDIEEYAQGKRSESKFALILKAILMHKRIDQFDEQGFLIREEGENE